MHSLLILVRLSQLRESLLLVQVPMVGCFPFASTKAARLRDAPRGCIAHVFALHVAEELPAWPESGQRRRTWVSH